jgi:hypothetical protein
MSFDTQAWLALTCPKIPNTIKHRVKAGSFGLSYLANPLIQSDLQEQLRRHALHQHIHHLIAPYSSF